jgi:deazaflavin-dependent oxidoreductase (nitroreductase family)
MTDTDIPSNLPDWIADHVKLYLESPDEARLWDSGPLGGPGILPCLLLITRGRKSGNISMLPLIYGEYEDSFVIVASKGGAAAHPAWYLNLEAEAECEIHVGSAQYKVKARTAGGNEREALWEKMAAIYPPYNDYQVTAGERQIPVVVLDPVGH